MADKFHIEPFDDGTLIKLELLKRYVRSWLPVFISPKNSYWNEIYIYDFFSGAGMDCKGNAGSPLIILNELRGYCHSIVDKGLKVRLLFNEPQSDVLYNLKNKVAEFFIKCQKQNRFDCCNACRTDNQCPFSIIIEQKDFKELFDELYPSMNINKTLPRFMFLDQFGIKQITYDIFQKLTKLTRTDFLFYISSSFVRRFSELAEFQRYIKVNKKDFNTSKPEHCHRIILDYYKSMTNGSNYYLAPFSISKGANIYGLIFGSNNPLGMEKYLDAAWSIDKNTGEANYNIDGDTIISGQLSIFPEDNVIKKVDIFERNLLEWLKTERTNKEVYLFTLTNGMRKTHTTDILKNHSKNLEIISKDKIQKGSFYLAYKPEKLIRIKNNE